MDPMSRTEYQERDVILVVPPVLNPNIPTLGASVLATACTRAGMTTRIHYAHASFAAHIGFELCERLAAAPPRRMLGEAIFLAAAFPERAHVHRDILDVLAQAQDPLAQFVRPAALTPDEIARCAAEVPRFISDTVARLLTWSPRIVGFSSMCQQTLPSIAIAGELKRLRPEIIIVLGGANACEPMGSAILEMTDAFDFVFSGEADIAFPEFCHAYLNRGELPDRRIITCTAVKDLNCVAPPTYDDYFREIEAYKADHALARKAPYWLIFESSRGCWWSEKLGCTFCGFNTPGGKYRVKRPEKLVAEIEDLVSQYGIHHMYAADTIMAQDFPRTVLSHLIQHGTNVTLSYEVKSNVGEEDLDTFVRAGVVEIQPGIESLSDHVLHLMAKGVRALENIRLLRDARSRGLEVIWNLLTAIPGEKREDYETILALIPQIEHLQPPTRWGPIRISRYSPYHRDPTRYGIGRLSPWPVYYDLFDQYAERVAQHFIGDYETEFTRDQVLQDLLDQALRQWASSWSQSDRLPSLHARSLGDGYLLVSDTRSTARHPVYLLDPAQVETLSLVRVPTHARSLSQPHLTTIEILADAGIVAASEGQYLSLVTEPEIGERLWSERQEHLDRT